jgi:hypothetical protein
VTKTAVSDRSFCPFVASSRWLALGGRRALWALATAGHNSNEIVETALVGQRERRLEELSIDPGLHGDEIGGVAGEGSRLVYSVRSFACTENPDSTVDCKPAENAVSGLWRVGRGAPSRVLRGSLAGIAVAGDRFAAVEDDFVPRGILIGDLRGVGIVKHVDAGSRVDRVAMSGTVVAAATADGLKFFDAHTGAPRGGAKPTGVSALAVSGDRVAFVRRKSIFMVERGRLTLLAARKLVPVGLTIERGLLLWAENPQGHGRIYRLSLPK